MLKEDKTEGEWKVEGIIKNTDNAIMILDKIIIDNEYYYPEHGKIIDKNSLFYLYIFPEEIKDINSIYIIISDVLSNKYKYKVICKKNEERKYYEIKYIKEEI